MQFQLDELGTANLFLMVTKSHITEKDRLTLCRIIRLAFLSGVDSVLQVLPEEILDAKHSDRIDWIEEQKLEVAESMLNLADYIPERLR